MEDCEVQRLESMKILHQLWTSENVILNAKLTQFLSLMAMLTVAYLTVAKEAWPKHGVCALGMAMSGLWFLSMRRTQRYREHWRSQTKIVGHAYSWWPVESGWSFADRCPSWVPVAVGPIVSLLVWALLLWQAL